MKNIHSDSKQLSCKLIIFLVLLLLVTFDRLISQNTSEYNNNSNIGGTNSAGFGSRALFNNTGDGNTALGKNSLLQNTTGVDNTALGSGALENNDTDENTALGAVALPAVTAHHKNTSCGSTSLIWCDGVGNTAFGYHNGGQLNSVNSYQNTFLGTSSDLATDGYHNTTAIGAGAIAQGSDEVRLGNSTISTVGGYATFSTPSDGRFKENISESDIKGLHFIMLLKPVDYIFNARKYAEITKTTASLRERERQEIGADSKNRAGFIAQEVEEAANACGFNFDGIKRPRHLNDTYGLSYSQFVVPLVKAVQEQDLSINNLKKAILLQSQLVDSILNIQTEVIDANKLNGKQQILFRQRSDGIIDVECRYLKEVSGYIAVFEVNGKMVLSNSKGEASSSLQILMANLPSDHYIVGVVINGKIVASKGLSVASKK